MLDEVAHEVRNPLVSIGGFARRVYDALPEGSLNRKYMEMILEDVARLENMVKQLIEIKSTSLLYMEPADINDVIMKALDALDQELEENAVNVETELMDNPPVIPADKEQMQKAIANIIKNAIESMTGGAGVLRVASRISDNVIEIRISDTGRGISKDKIRHIFDPLFTSKIYGPGLGLPFALKIIQDHRGTISVESEPEKGSTFTIRLPLRKL
ncbi:MAG: ATP-binding protein [Nitrospirota bacterium]|nr:ATP-binding protein [Nitrospirota bacterium]